MSFTVEILVLRVINKGIQGYSRVYRGIHGYTGYTRVYRGIHGYLVYQIMPVNVHFSDNLSTPDIISRYTSRRKGFVYLITLPLILFAIKPRVNMVKKPVVI